MKKIIAGMALMVFSGCGGRLEGPPVDLQAISTPEPVQEVMVPVSPVAPQRPGVWRTWIPRYVDESGTVTEGHWMEIDSNAPAMQYVEPVKTIPKAPKTPFQKVKTGKQNLPQGQYPWQQPGAQYQVPQEQPHVEGQQPYQQSYPLPAPNPYQQHYTAPAPPLEGGR